MLKRTDPPGGPEPDSLGDLFGRAKDEGRAWVEAEVALYKTIGTEKVNAWKVPVAMLAAAAYLAHAAAIVLIATIFVALAQVMNPALAGVVTLVILLAGAAILAKVALGKLKGAGK
jgi:hypothetical protein